MKTNDNESSENRGSSGNYSTAATASSSISTDPNLLLRKKLLDQGLKAREKEVKKKNKSIRENKEPGKSISNTAQAH